MKRIFFTTPVAAAVLLFAGESSVCASALTGFFYQMSSSDPDRGRGIGQGLVENQLGPNGLPVLSAFGFSQNLGNSADINPLTHELLWWSPGLDPFVSLDSNPVQTTTLPIVQTSNFFPTGQSDDFTFLRTVHWTGSFNLASPGSVALTLGSDDDAFVFIDSQLAIDDGGIHPLSVVSNTITNLSAGNHSIDIFFSDRDQSQSGIELFSDVVLNPTTPSTTPEPASIALVSIGIACIGLCARRRKAKHSRRQKSGDLLMA